MRPSQPSLATGIRILAVAVVPFASLRLALAVALVTFLIRQGQESVDALPVVFLWLGVTTLGLVLYTRGERVGERVLSFLEHRRRAT